jgi:molybdate transport system substrate-binding protein
MAFPEQTRRARRGATRVTLGRRTLVRIAGVLVSLSTLVAADAAAAEPAHRELVVFAATSVREPFANLAVGFEAKHPGVKVRISTAGSDELRHWIEHGARPDVISSSDWKQVNLLADLHRAEPPSRFACNQLVIVARPDLAVPIRGLGDLPRVARLVVGIDGVPVGRYAREAVKKAAAAFGEDFPKRVEARIVSREKVARLVVEKVASGGADAGITYRNEALAPNSKLKVIPIEPQFDVVAEYTIAVVKDSLHPDLAQQWIELVQSSEGIAALRDAGFVPCPRK